MAKPWLGSSFRPPPPPYSLTYESLTDFFTAVGHVHVQQYYQFPNIDIRTVPTPLQTTQTPDEINQIIAILEEIFGGQTTWEGFKAKVASGA
jgi:hypothetical protein